MNVDEYILSRLSEECCEVGQRVSKALNFGMTEVQSGQDLNNDERIAEEMKDVISVAIILQRRGQLTSEFMPTEEEIEAKLKRIKKYAKISVEQGCLVDDEGFVNS